MGHQDFIKVAWDRQGNLLLSQDRLYEGDHELRVSRDYFPQFVQALDVLREVIVDAIQKGRGVMSDPAPFILQEYGGKLYIRCRRPYPQKFQIDLLEVPALIAEIVKAVRHDVHGAALVDQIIAAARAHRRHDRTNAERQRRFRQRRRARQVGMHSSVKKATSA